MIYLDYQATTPLAPEVKAAMAEWVDHYANPHSPSTEGRRAAAAIAVARGQVERAFFAPPALREGKSAKREGEGMSPLMDRPSPGSLREPSPPAPAGGAEGRLVFTSGATEALNWAIKGTMERSSRRKLVTIATEHAAVLDCTEWLEWQGVEVVRLPVGADGMVDLGSAEAAIDQDTALVAAMFVNNEIGVIQPVAALARMAHAAGALMLCDAVQGFGRMAIPAGPDMIAVSAHKVHGPKGIGALWLREGVEPAPLLHGGGQERGLRSGTLSPALCAGFGAAAALIVEQREADAAHVERLWQAARTALGAEWTLNGSAEARYHGNLNIRREGLDGARLLADCRDIGFSLGSACASGSGRPSHVLRAIGLSDREARSSIRLGFGRYTDEAELFAACRRIDETARAQAVIA